MTYTITTTSEEDAGLTAAREAYNAAIPDTEEAPRASHPDYKADNQAYASFVMAGAFESYQRQYRVGAHA